MKKMQTKSILLLALVIVVLTAVVGGTVAYLATRTLSVTNTFEPANVEVVVTDKVSGNTKSDVVIENKSNIPVYLRVAVVANWCDKDGNVVAQWNAYGDLGVNASDWEREGNVFYYKHVVSAGASVTLFNEYKAPAAPEGAEHLEMDIIAQVIQSAGIPGETYKTAWAQAANN